MTRVPENLVNPGSGKLPILALTTNFTLEASESGYLITDEAMSPPGGNFQVTMPLATPGLHFYFSCTGVADNIVIGPSFGSGDVFHFPDGLEELAGILMDATAQAHFSCDEAGVWNFVSGCGKFTLPTVPDIFWANGPFENAPLGAAPGIIFRREGNNSIGSQSSYPFVPGRNCEVGDNCTDVSLIGNSAKGVTTGQKAQASSSLHSLGDLSVPGTSQIGDIHLRALTLNDSPTEMLAGLAGSGDDGEYVYIGPNRAVMADIRVVAKTLIAPNDQQTVMWRVRIGVLTDNAGAITQIGTNVEAERMFETALGDEDTWTVNVEVASVPSRIKVEITGDAAEAIGWTARVQLTEVAGRLVT